VLLGLKSKPTTATQARDHNSGVAITQALGGYLTGKGRAAIAHFRGVLRDPRVAALVDRIDDLRARWFAKPGADRSIFDEFRGMESISFAAERAAELTGRSRPQTHGRRADTTPRTVH
jgi:hypothetical protein